MKFTRPSARGHGVQVHEDSHDDKDYYPSKIPKHQIAQTPKAPDSTGKTKTTSCRKTTFCTELYAPPKAKKLSGPQALAPGDESARRAHGPQ